jgi:hypothetical protein
MAFGTPATLVTEHGQQPGAPSFFVRISFPGDGAYVAGGTVGFEAFMQAAVGGRALEIVGIIAEDCGGYVPVYDKTNDKLKVYEQTNVATSPLIETVTADLSLTTFNVICICK